MYITLESDYAVRIVGCLASNKKRLDAKTISEKTGVTLRFALKILRNLVASGIIKSYKGTQGGYELAKAPKDISIKDVIETVEGKYHLSRCLSDGYDCSRQMSEGCKFRHVFNEISIEVEKNFRHIPLICSYRT